MMLASASRTTDDTHPVHATFLILIGFIVLSHWSAGSGLAKTLEGVGFILAMFACIVLHEFGHALMAARYGIQPFTINTPIANLNEGD